MTTTGGITGGGLSSLLKTNTAAKSSSDEIIREMQEKWKKELQSSPVLQSGAGNLLQPTQATQQDVTDQNVTNAVSAIMESMSDASAKTKTETQIIAQQSGLKTESGDSKTSIGSSATDKFMAFMDSAKEGPAAFWRAQFLASQGLTEKDVASMSPEDKAKLEDKIKTFIQQKMEEAKHQSVKQDNTGDTAKLDTGNQDLAKSGLISKDTADAKDKSSKGPFNPADLFDISSSDAEPDHNRREDAT